MSLALLQTPTLSRFCYVVPSWVVYSTPYQKNTRKKELHSSPGVDFEYWFSSSSISLGAVVAVNLGP